MEETESRPTMDFRSHILTELALSERIIRKGMGVAPRFTVFAPDGAHTAMVELPDGEQERSKQLSAIRGFMIFKAARGFLLASEIIDPDVISVIAVRRSEVIGALKHINRDPLSFGKTEWFGRENLPRSYVQSHLPLVFSAPKTVLAILEGNQPADLTLKQLMYLTDSRRIGPSRAASLGLSPESCDPGNPTAQTT